MKKEKVSHHHEKAMHHLQKAHDHMKKALDGHMKEEVKEHHSKRSYKY